MSLLASKYSAQDAERPVLAPLWLVLSLVALVAVALWLIYPRQDLERRLLEAGRSELADAYLANLLRSDPDNPRLRFLLAQRTLEDDDQTDAEETLALAEALDDRAVQRQALWAQWEVLASKFYALPTAAEAERQQQTQAMQDKLRKLAKPELELPTEQGQRLAELSMQFGLYDQAFALHQQYLPEVSTASLYERAAAEQLARGQYQQSSQFLLQARQAGAGADTAQSKALLMRAIRTLQSGNQAQAALELAERESTPYATDKEYLLLLVELARAAGRPDKAEPYVRRLLKLALLEQFAPAADSAFAQTSPYDDGAQWLQRPGLSVVDKPQPAPSATPSLAFDDKTYSLGYLVFLENGNLEDAWALAQAAVRQQPGHMQWRQRLAEVSEWTGRLPQALENWLPVAQHTNQAIAWQAVLRLAPGLFDDHALTQALRHQLRSQPHNWPLVQSYIDAQERMGEPQPAIDYLKVQNHPKALEMLAELAERASQLPLALNTWKKLLAQPTQITARRALPAALLAFTQGEQEQGLQWLEAVRNQPPSAEEDATEYWQIMATMAESRNHLPLAIEAYRKLLSSPNPASQDFDGLIRLLLDQQPMEAADIAWRAWQTHHQPAHLVQALTIWSNRNQWERFSQALEQVVAEQTALPLLEKTPEFLRLLGTYHQNAGRLDLARHYFQAGLAQAPHSDAMRQALLWLFIDSNDAASIRQLLSSYEAQWSQSTHMHESLASAYQALSQPKVALERYLQPHAAQRQRDFLWLMNYADALDQNQQTDQAWRLRRHLLSHQWQQAQRQTDEQGQRLTRSQAQQRWLTQEGLDTVHRIARTRLMLTQNPGDPARAVLQELLRLDRDAKGNYSNAAAETAIGWLQDAGEFTAERSFLYHQYARSHSLRSNRPLWADITLGLAEDDKASTGELLEAFDERLPRYDRINAAAAVHDIRLAQSAAFETQEQQGDDNPLHLQLTENLLAFSDFVRPSISYEKLGDMDEVVQDITLHWALSPRLYLDISMASVRRLRVSPNFSDAIPEEKIFDMLLGWRHPDGQTQLSIGHRDAYANTTPVLLRHEQRIDNRLSWTAELGRHLSTQESLPLRLVGMKNMASISLGYQATRQDRMAITHAAERYYLQTGAQVGSGQHTTLDYAHTYRLDAPLVEVGGFWSTHRYRQRDPDSLGAQGLQAAQRILPPGSDAPGRGFYLPENFRFYGVHLSTNMRFEQEYTRALRPYAMVSRTWHSDLGPGYGLRLGVAGNVLGPDHLSLTWAMSKSGAQSLGHTRSLQVNYRLHF